jgi:hypothetical protein
MVHASGAALAILVVPLSEPNAGSAAVLVDELEPERSMSAGFTINQTGFFLIVSDRRLASFSFWLLVQPFSGLLQP